MFSLPKLNYNYADLEPHIDAKTMEIHYTKHHQTYVDKLNLALDKYPELSTKSVEELLKSWDQIPAEIQTPVRNHGGGHVNHSLFWQIISPGGSREPSGKLKADIISKWGSVFQFQTLFSDQAAAHFGSGWAWLSLGADQQLLIETLSNQDSPYLSDHEPIMGLDVWEHAYYLKYQNRRPEYIAAFWQIVNWDEVSEIYESLMK